jgi:hypothetical protein
MQLPRGAVATLGAVEGKLQGRPSIQDEGIVREDALWAASETALDGASKESMVERIEKARSETDVPQGANPDPANTETDRPVVTAPAPQECQPRREEMTARTHESLPRRCHFPVTCMLIAEGYLGERYTCWRTD